MIPILFIIQLKINISEKNQAKVKEMSYETPIFALFYSHYCGHCKRVYPTWTEMRNFYENDTGIITAESDCVDHHDTCNYYLKVNGYPTFAYIINGVAKEVRITRTLEKFKEFVDELKQNDPKSSCRSWFPIEESINYPVFVYSSPKKHAEACAEIEGFVNKDLENLVFVDSQYAAIQANSTRAQDIAATKKSTQLEVRYDHSHKTLLYDEADEKYANIENKNEFLYQSIIQNRHTPLGDFKKEEIMQITRPMILLLYFEKRHINQYIDTAFRNSENFVFAKMNITDFMGRFPNIPLSANDAPTLVVTNSEKTKCMTLTNFTPPLLTQEKLDGIKNGDYNDQMIYPLFKEESQQQNNKGVEAQDEKQNSVEIKNGNQFVYLSVFIAVAIVIAILVFFIIKFCNMNQMKKRNYYLDKSCKNVQNACSDCIDSFLSKFGVTQKKDVLL